MASPITMRASSLPLLLPALVLSASCAVTPAHARGGDELAGLINAYRAAPAACPGHASGSLPPLTPEDALARVVVGPATFLESALGRLGYEADQAEAIGVTGPPDAAGAFEVLRQKHCATLLSTELSAVGTARNGNAWQVVLARPHVEPVLPAWPQAGQELVTLVNAVRAQGYTCGAERFGPAAPVEWNPELAEAALAHSADMAARRYFDHKAPDGSMADGRAARAGYRAVRVGENIASGQHSVQEVLTSWLESPGHCANIMNPGFRDMGAAYVIHPDNRHHTPYWTQVFGASR
jgi:hypothetical protein